MMSPEDCERTANFLVEQQTRTAAKLEALTDEVRELTAHEAVQDRVLLTVLDTVRRMETGIEALCVQTAETDRRLAETDKRLNAFIFVVKRHIAGHNGNTRPS